MNHTTNEVIKTTKNIPKPQYIFNICRKFNTITNPIPKVNIRENLRQNIFKYILSSFFNINLKNIYVRMLERENIIKKKLKAKVNILIQLYSPISLNGKNVESESKYNKITTERTSKNVNV